MLCMEKIFYFIQKLMISQQSIFEIVLYEGKCVLHFGTLQAEFVLSPSKLFVHFLALNSLKYSSPRI